MSKTTYWFKRRRYGYGWMPVTWQGWLTIAVCIGVILGAGYYFEQQTKDSSPSIQAMSSFMITILITTLTLIFISYRKGPEPKWRWGQQPEDSPEEDF